MHNYAFKQLGHCGDADVRMGGTPLSVPDADNRELFHVPALFEIRNFTVNCIDQSAANWGFSAFHHLPPSIPHWRDIGLSNPVIA
jgi:hypothetical protein